MHRNHRTEQIRAALAKGATTPAEIAAIVYAGIPGVDLTLAALQVQTHLNFLQEADRN
jgi:predicted RNA-binding protein